MTDNSFRRDFTDVEKMRAVERMDRVGISLEEIGGTMGVSKETVKRYLIVAQQPTLREFLEKGIMPYTKLARIGKPLDDAKDKAQMSQWITETMGSWLDATRDSIATYEAECSRFGRKPEPTKTKLDSATYLPPWLVESWVTDLEKSQKPTGAQPPRDFKPEISEDEIDVRISLVPQKASIEDLAKAVVTLREASIEASHILRRKKKGTLGGRSFFDSEEYLRRVQALVDTPDTEDASDT